MVMNRRVGRPTESHSRVSVTLSTHGKSRVSLTECSALHPWVRRWARGVSRAQAGRSDQRCQEQGGS